MGGPPRPGIFDWRRQVLQIIFFVAFVAALGYAASQGSFDFLENEVSLTVVPNRTLVDFGASEPPVIQLHVKLKNNTNNPVTLEAESPCKVIKWVILAAPSMDMVQARGGAEVACPDQPIRRQFEPGQEIEEFYALELNPVRFSTAGDYQIHIKYFGYTAIVPFEVKVKSP